MDELAEECRFSDCAHDGTPGCALARAVADGDVDPIRLRDYLAYLEGHVAQVEARAAADRLGRRERNRRHRP
jgi:ribosome biogenesis GTPase